MSKESKNYNWLSDEEWGKLKWRTRANISLILTETRRWYGQEKLVEGQEEALMDLVEQTWDIVRGKNKPIKPHPFTNRYRDDTYGADD